ncbi:radical SAM/SPASM domain-containing protein [Methanobacterium paludis]|uniref:Radical SAM domain protein n=1 Tax=Methanobacterium paludis (strain DSM 25820 / JCM 18151 / SWAN1) TaxID=868131 RepID=F6D3Y5_METPW|nr:radical SAM/SPASM domain-containing protein [Methanobacterium paludis]AEG18787.1 Radical SAM domain protein [Methanobacterium paludis]
MDFESKVNENHSKGEYSNDESDPDLGSMIQTFESIVDNPISKFLLHKTLTYCENDEANRLESALKIYLDTKGDLKKNSCHKCRFLSKFVGYVVKKGAVSFGVSEEELKTQMQEEYWAKGLTSVLKGIAQFGVKKPFIPGAPFQIVWNITKACNMKCIHCYEKAGKKDEDELNSKEIKKGLEILARAGVTSVAFSGGEPTVHPHIMEFIRYVKELGMFPSIATNGYILANPEICKKFAEAGLKFVQISIDGLDPTTHNTFRGVNGAWEKAVKAVKNCVNEGMFVEVATTVTEYNLNEIPDMINFVRSLGANWFMLYNFIPTGNGNEIKCMDISPQERYKLLETAYKENSGDMQILSTAPQYAMVAEALVSKDHNMIPTHFYNPEYSNPTVMQLAEFIGGCGAGRFYMSIEPNGDMYPCVFFPHENEVKVGKLLEDDFEELWQNSVILSKLRDKSVIKGHCGECKSKNVCGGCRARAYNYFHDVLAPDPGCINNKKEWQKIQAEMRDAQKLPHGELILNLKRSKPENSKQFRSVKKYGCGFNKSM